jgi:signal transduction histidine kinase
VVYLGELLGCLALAGQGNETLNPAEAKLVQDLASQAGLMMSNVLLMEDLRASRQRIVAAQDEERRRLERDIHDGAQQDLITLSLAARLAETQLGQDADPKLHELLSAAAVEIKATLTELRELANGIHPAVLTEQGLGPALHSLAERATVPVEVRVDLAERLDPTVEATAYFVVSEALANVGKYADASSVHVTAQRFDGHLRLDVADDGRGGADPSKGSGLRGLQDRVAAVNGSLAVDSPVGAGTRLRVELPCA